MAKNTIGSPGDIETAPGTDKGRGSVGVFSHSKSKRHTNKVGTIGTQANSVNRDAPVNKKTVSDPRFK